MKKTIYIMLVVVALATAHSFEAIASNEVSQEVVDALATGDLDCAREVMRGEAKTPKLIYLARETTRVINLEEGEKPHKLDAHATYRAIAIGYHNLYLFLKSKGVEGDRLFKRAHKFYRKARRYGTSVQKTECNILDAALYAAAGNSKKAQKIFEKQNVGLMAGGFESMEYLAAYHAATGEVTTTIEALESAYRIDPRGTLAWVEIGDDFYKIEGEPVFQGMLSSWRAKPAKDELALSTPKATAPRLEVIDATGIFHPPKKLPRYRLRRRRR